MKIRFLKEINGYKKGDEDDVVTARAKAYIEDGYAELATKEKKEAPTKKEKNANAGPGK